MLNNLKFHYEVVPSLGKLCPPRDEFVQLFHADNLQGTPEREFTYTEAIGITRSTEVSKEERMEYQFHVDVGLSLDFGYESLEANFKENFECSLETNYEWSSAKSSTWESQTTATIRIPIPAHTRTRVYQVVGRCTFCEIVACQYKFVDSNEKGIVTNTTFKPHI